MDRKRMYQQFVSYMQNAMDRDNIRSWLTKSEVKAKTEAFPWTTPKQALRPNSFSHHGKAELALCWLLGVGIRSIHHVLYKCSKLAQ